MTKIQMNIKSINFRPNCIDPNHRFDSNKKELINNTIKIFNNTSLKEININQKILEKEKKKLILKLKKN